MLKNDTSYDNILKKMKNNGKTNANIKRFKNNTEVKLYEQLEKLRK